jgi:flavin reductase (DIM6/NTAB) family NADH-FMN oxidoreductase RutF
MLLVEGRGMFYEPRKKNHGLPHDPFKAIVAPRPIGWISSMSARGEINLAPYSFFNGLSAEPPLVMFCSDGRKDSVVFAEETKEFVCNLATWNLREQMNATSEAYPRGVDEMKEAGLEAAPSVLVKPLRVKASPCAMECKWLQTVRVDDLEDHPTQRYVVFGQVVGVYIDERFTNGLLDTAAMRPIARAGYRDYFVSTPETKFSLRRPKEAGADHLDSTKVRTTLAVAPMPESVQGLDLDDRCAVVAADP